MQENSRPFVLGPPALYAWLFREELRKGQAIDDPDAQLDFLAWWVVFGARQYGQEPQLTQADRELLFSPLLSLNRSASTGSCRFARRVLRTQNDMTRQFDLSGKEAQVAANAFARTVESVLLGAPGGVNADDVARLNDLPPLIRKLQQAGKEAEISWLMLFLWQLHPRARQVFNLADSPGRLRMLFWFFGSGLQESGLFALLNDRVRGWLLVPKGNPAVSRAALVLWRTRPDLQKACDLKSPDGWGRLAQWVAESEDREPLLRWVGKSPAPSGKVSKGRRTAVKPSAPSKQPATPRPFGVNLIGCAFGELGIGEDLRMAAAACDAAGIPCSVINIDAGGGLPENDRLLEARVAGDAADLKYPINLFCLSGFDTAIVRLRYGDRFFRNEYNIGWWPWELPVWPRHWASAFDLVNEVWAATQFTHAMYSTATSKPVTLMPLPVSVDRRQLLSSESLGLASDRFLFLYVFFNGNPARKNPVAVVEAFRKAFPSRDKSVGLVLKVMNPKTIDPMWAELKALCGKDKRISIIDARLDRPAVLGLIDACDAYVSLHRAEGFGRTLAEAMLLGKPVVGTDYSGSRDFLTAETGFPVQHTLVPVRVGEYPYVEEGEAVWAEPDIAHAVSQMRRARSAADKAGYAARVRDRANEMFSPERIGTTMRSRLESIYAGLSFVDVAK